MESSDERQQQFKCGKKSFFFGGKKKKRKPVCTCHLGYASNELNGTGAGYQPNTANHHIYASPVKQASNYQPTWNESSSQTVVETTSQCFTRQQQQHYSSGYQSAYGPHSNATTTYQPALSLSPQHHPSMAQMIEYQVPQQLPAMSLQPVPYGMDGCANYLQSVDDKKYLYAANGNPGGVYPQTSTYSPDLNLHRRLYGSEGLEVPGRQRRWSDGGSRHTRIDQEAMQQEGGYTPPPKGFTCECAQCTRALPPLPAPPPGSQYPLPPGANYSPRPKPKVSFGPLMTYPNDSNEQALMDGKAPKKVSKLTTELLPLDTQFPLLMSDSAMLCTIQ